MKGGFGRTVLVLDSRLMIVGGRWVLVDSCGSLWGPMGSARSRWARAGVGVVVVVLTAESDGVRRCLQVCD